MKTYNRFGKYQMVGRDDGIDFGVIITYLRRRIKLFFSKKCPDCNGKKDTGYDILLCNKCIKNIWER